ncbi:hypothetical protein HPT27_02760 [Permianibacter sp. IMCC34836]|uniref:hypothetical protein n=1 Tax=Permianibacter fluminis TaxID=2738515 RepID=UPI0015576F0C|nr:hypothetical protein [Permianibacter fluminis]NQD35927.1 hypothetical protein [Permianibacter fluminis]
MKPLSSPSSFSFRQICWQPAARASSSLIVALLLLQLSTKAQAVDAGFRLCTEDQPSLPLSNLDPAHPGTAQVLIATAASNLKLNIEHYTDTWQNCQRHLKAGTTDAANIASYAGINKVIAVFPMRGDSADPSKALGHIPTLLYRRVGTNVDFVNGTFVNLKTSVGVLNSYQANSVDVGRAGGIVDDRSHSVHSLARRLLAGKLDLVAADPSLAELVKREYSGQIEALPNWLNNEPHYLVFTPTYYARNRDLVEAFWAELARLRSRQP